MMSSSWASVAVQVHPDLCYLVQQPYMAVYSQSKKLNVILATFHVPSSHGELGHFYGTVKIWNISTLKASLAPNWKVITMEDVSLFRLRAGKVGRKEGTRGVWGLFSHWPWQLQES